MLNARMGRSLPDRNVDVNLQNPTIDTPRHRLSRVLPGAGLWSATITFHRPESDNNRTGGGVNGLFSHQLGHQVGVESAEENPPVRWQTPGIEIRLHCWELVTSFESNAGRRPVPALIKALAATIATAAHRAVGLFSVAAGHDVFLSFRQRRHNVTLASGTAACQIECDTGTGMVHLEPLTLLLLAGGCPTTSFPAQSKSVQLCPATGRAMIRESGAPALPLFNGTSSRNVVARSSCPREYPFCPLPPKHRSGSHPDADDAQQVPPEAPRPVPPL